jgi:hypothetical protein
MGGLVVRRESSWARGGRRSRPEGQIEFVGSRAAGYVGTDQCRRQWRITATRVGWQLEFRDPGDTRPTYAGTHRSLAAAEREANE